MQTAAGTPQGNTLRIGRIVKCYPDKHVVDVVFLDDGGFASGVGLSTQWGSQDHGFRYMPKIKDPPDGHWGVELGGNDSLALVGYFSGMPFVVGSMFPANKGEMSSLLLNELMIKSYVGAFLFFNQHGVATLAGRNGLGGEEGHGGHSPTVVLDPLKDMATMFNDTCSVTMDMFGTVTVLSGAGNKIIMDGQTGAIEMKSGGGAVINMSAGGIIELNPSSPSDPV